MPQAWQTCLWTVLLIRVGWEASLHSHFQIFQEIIRFKSGLWLGRSRTFTKVTLLKAWLRAWGHCPAESWTEVTAVHWNRFACRCNIPTAWCYLFRYLSANSRLAAVCLLPRSGFCLPRRPDWWIAAEMAVLLEGSLSIKKPLSVESNRQVLGHLSDWGRSKKNKKKIIFFTGYKEKNGTCKRKKYKIWVPDSYLQISR